MVHIGNHWDEVLADETVQAVYLGRGKAAS